MHAKWRTHRSRAIRSYATSSTSTASPIAQSPTSILGTLTTELDKISPRFELQSSQIRILKSPVDFYEALKVGSYPLFPEWRMSALFLIYEQYKHAGTCKVRNLVLWLTVDD